LGRRRLLWWGRARLRWCFGRGAGVLSAPAVAAVPVAAVAASITTAVAPAALVLAAGQAHHVVQYRVQLLPDLPAHPGALDVSGPGDAGRLHAGRPLRHLGLIRFRHVTPSPSPARPGRHRPGPPPRSSTSPGRTTPPPGRCP